VKNEPSEGDDESEKEEKAEISFPLRSFIHLLICSHIIMHLFIHRIAFLQPPGTFHPMKERLFIFSLSVRP